MNEFGAGGPPPPVGGVAPGAPASDPGHSSELLAAWGQTPDAHTGAASKTPQAWMPVRPAAPAAQFRAAAPVGGVRRLARAVGADAGRLLPNSARGAVCAAGDFSGRA